MLSRKSRLTKNKDWKRVLRIGRGFHSHLLTVRIAPGQERTRIGFIVGTKVSKRATERNLIKRRLRSIVSEYRGRLIPGKEVAIIARPSASGATYHSIKGELINLFDKARLLS